jgi:uncharacterized lipoprotein YmbA
MNTWKRVAALLLAAPLAAGLASCGATTAPVLLTLPPAASAPALPGVVPVGPMRVLALNRLEVPEYLAVRRVRYRTDASTLAEWPYTYWGERFEVGASRELAAALRARLAGWELCDSRCGERSPAATLQLRLDRVDYLRSQRRLQASVYFTLWRAGRAPGILRSETRSYDIDGDDDTAQSQARAISQLLQRVADDVSLALDAAP